MTKQAVGCAILGVVLLASASPAWAQADIVKLRENASAAEVGKAFDSGPSAADLEGELPPGLLPTLVPPGGATGPTFRGAEGAAPASTCPPTRRRVSMEISFDRGSAKLTDTALVALNKVADAMLGPRLALCRFTIVGHTDAKGAASANQKLSEERAASVKAYLGLRKVAAERLITQGVGESQPVNGQDPEASENRRVEFFIEP